MGPKLFLVFYFIFHYTAHPKLYAPRIEARMLWWFDAMVERMEITYSSPSCSDLVTTAATKTTMPARTVKIIPLQHPTFNATSSSSSSSYPNAVFSRWVTKLRRMSWVEWIEFFLPCCGWIRTYKWREYLQVDLMAGVTVGVMLVPQVIHARLWLVPRKGKKVNFRSYPWIFQLCFSWSNSIDVSDWE